jgi:hypothetical protein
MEDKFSYTDFIAYFIPGAIFIWSIILSLKSLNFSDRFSTSDQFIDVIFFLVLAFTAGHLIQARAIIKLASSIRKSRGSDALLSQIYLIKSEKYQGKVEHYNEADRQRYIQIATKHLGYSQDEIKKLASDSPEARQISHSIFRILHSLIYNNKAGERAGIFSAHYKFFLGLAQSSLYTAVILLLSSFVLLFLIFLNKLTWVDKWMYVIGFSLVSTLWIYGYFVFKKSAKNREELHVQEVFNSAYVLFFSENNEERTLSNDN